MRNKRNDATLATDVPSYVKIFPFLMKRRCDSLVYHKISLDMTNVVKFVREYNKTHKGEHCMRFFDVMLAAFTRLIAMRPKLNRFIANYSAWQRNEISFLFVVKESMSDDAPEHNAMVKVEPGMTLIEISKLTEQIIEAAKQPGQDKETDMLIEKYLKLPKSLIVLVVRFFGWLEKHGRLPAAIREVDGLHSTAVLANLGSLNLLTAPIHHLYEWGTTSIFVTIGSLYRGVHPEHENINVDLLDAGFTIDERIADGMYIIRSLNMLQDYLRHPETLMERPEHYPKVPKNYTEWKEMKKRGEL